VEKLVADEKLREVEPVEDHKMCIMREYSYESSIGEDEKTTQAGHHSWMMSSLTRQYF
jgi:hypothetical protein